MAEEFSMIYGSNHSCPPARTTETKRYLDPDPVDFFFSKKLRDSERNADTSSTVSQIQTVKQKDKKCRGADKKKVSDKQRTKRKCREFIGSTL